MCVSIICEYGGTLLANNGAKGGGGGGLDDKRAFEDLTGHSQMLAISGICTM